jgi:hypothetical protein
MKPTLITIDETPPNYVPPIDIEKVEEVVKELDDQTFYMPHTKEEVGTDPKDGQIAALAYLLIAVCIPTIEAYMKPARHGTRAVDQIRKANNARKILRAAGF